MQKPTVQKKGWMIAVEAFKPTGMHFFFLKSSCVKVCAVNHIMHVINKAKTVRHYGPQTMLRVYCVDVKTAGLSQQVCAHPHKHTLTMCLCDAAEQHVW